MPIYPFTNDGLSDDFNDPLNNNLGSGNLISDDSTSAPDDSISDDSPPEATTPADLVGSYNDDGTFELRPVDSTDSPYSFLDNLSAPVPRFPYDNYESFTALPWYSKFSSEYDPSQGPIWMWEAAMNHPANNPLLNGLDNDGNLLPQYQGQSLVPNSNPTWSNVDPSQIEPPNSYPYGSTQIPSNMGNPYLQGLLDPNGQYVGLDSTDNSVSSNPGTYNFSMQTSSSQPKPFIYGLKAQKPQSPPDYSWPPRPQDLMDQSNSLYPTYAASTQDNSMNKSTSLPSGGTLQNVAYSPQATQAPAPPDEFEVYASEFSGKGDTNYSAYGPYDKRTGLGPLINPDSLGGSLPAYIKERPNIRVTNPHNGKYVDVPLIDVGPFNTSDRYWVNTKSNYRPLTEEQHRKKMKTPSGTSINPAGIDLTPATFRALGIFPDKNTSNPDNNTLTKVKWRFIPNSLHKNNLKQ